MNQCVNFAISKHNSAIETNHSIFQLLNTCSYIQCIILGKHNTQMYKHNQSINQAIKLNSILVYYYVQCMAHAHACHYYVVF